MHDGNMREIIHDDIFVQSLVAWLSAGISGGKGGDGVVLLAGDDEVRMAGALAIGNLARSGKVISVVSFR